MADPPSPEKAALMARYVIHTVGWVTVSTISAMDQIKSFPYNTLLDMCDGLNEQGNGVPYLYITIYDPLHDNIQENTKCTLMGTLAITEWCEKQNYEQEDPRCPRVMLTGNLVKIANDTEEYRSALDNMYAKHPRAKHWPAAHNWYIAKVDVKLVTLFDAFGGLKTIDLDEYYNANDFDHLNKLQKIDGY
ncbi:hypothetical protein FQR65_LT07318 [Abscondita terminalis]|nr:hypothetical protein FQR65_LT07318 [Abscondita terminalis]